MLHIRSRLSPRASVGRKKSQSSVYVNQCSVGGRVMTLVCKNNTSSTRERAFAFASFSPSLSRAQRFVSVDRLGKRVVLLLLLLLFLDQSNKFDLVVCAMLFSFFFLLLLLLLLRWHSH